MPLVPTITTVFSQTELAEALYRAHVAYFGSPPQPARLACAWAHNVLECGRDAHNNIAHCRCFNLGNITVKSQDVPFWSITCAEQQRNPDGSLNGKWVSTVMRFAAFDTLLDGAVYYWAFIVKRPASFQEMSSGIGYAFGMALAHEHYMTANPETYARSLGHLSDEGRSFINGLDLQAKEGDTAQAEKLMDLIALTLDDSIKDGLNTPTTDTEGDNNT